MNPIHETTEPEWMARAVAQAALARSNGNLPHPNPAVGCILVNPQGMQIGQGFTQPAGGPHAEVMAVADATARGHSTNGATAYVTLEPCSHYGRTGPCCDALVAAGIQSVVAATADPNPLVSGQGFARLRAAGVRVKVGPGADPAASLNRGFFSRMIRKRPWVRVKVAASLDGKTALKNGQSQWITGELARKDGHAWRACAGAVLTGIGTVLEDDPLLDVRLVATQRQPLLVIVDSRLQTPLNAKLFTPGRQVLIYCAVLDSAKKVALEAKGSIVVRLPGSNGSVEKVDLTDMMLDLAMREINEVHVEAGHKLNGSLMRERLVDEWLVYLAPKMIGLGRDMAIWGPITALAGAVPLVFSDVCQVGPDIRIVAQLSGAEEFIKNL